MSLAENYSTILNADFSTVNDLHTAKGFVETYHKETNRLPDNFYYWIGPEGIIEPGEHRYLHSIHTPEKHWIPYLGETEFNAIKQIDKFSKHEDGYIIWSSLKFDVPGGYPAHKIEIMEITKSPAGNKKTKNIVIVFDSSNTAALKILKDSFPEEFGETTDLEDIRKQVVYRDKNFNIWEVLHIISQYLPNDEVVPPLTESNKHYIATLILEHRNNEYIATEMLSRDILGKYSITCPPGMRNSFSNSLTLNSNVVDLREQSMWEYHLGKCVNCGASETLVGPCSICKTCEKVL